MTFVFCFDRGNKLRLDNHFSRLQSRSKLLLCWTPKLWLSPSSFPSLFCWMIISMLCASNSTPSSILSRPKGLGQVPSSHSLILVKGRRWRLSKARTYCISHSVLLLRGLLSYSAQEFVLESLHLWVTSMKDYGLYLFCLHCCWLWEHLDLFFCWYNWLIDMASIGELPTNQLLQAGS